VTAPPPPPTPLHPTPAHIPAHPPPHTPFLPHNPLPLSSPTHPPRPAVAARFLVVVVAGYWLWLRFCCCGCRRCYCCCCCDRSSRRLSECAGVAVFVTTVGSRWCSPTALCCAGAQLAAHRGRAVLSPLLHRSVPGRGHQSCGCMQHQSSDTSDQVCVFVHWPFASCLPCGQSLANWSMLMSVPHHETPLPPPHALNSVCSCPAGAVRSCSNGTEPRCTMGGPPSPVTVQVRCCCVRGCLLFVVVDAPLSALAFPCVRGCMLWPLRVRAW
jgi:hypothetical protein